jgi:hypothetical protein
MSTMQTIHLGYKDYTVTDATYEKIVALVHAERICKNCEQPYSSDNPEALKNRCLACVKKQSSLPYIGKHRLFTSEYHCFKEKDGYLSLASPSAESLSRSVNATLQFYGFSYPVEWEGKRIYNEWSVSGSPEQDTCVMLEAYVELWHEAKRKYDTKKVEFFSFKHKGFLPVNRRKKYVRELFRKATAIIEQSKDARGQYHIQGNTFYFLPEHWVNVEAVKLVEYTKL